MSKSFRKLSSTRSEPDDSLLREQSVAVHGDPTVRRSVLSEKLVSTFYDDVTTTYEGFLRGCRISGNSPCLGRRGQKLTTYQWISYNRVHEKATNLGSALIHLGCKPSQDTFVGIYAQNCVEWCLTDLACQMFSMISVPIYDTHGPDACVHIINHADVDTIVCSDVKVPFLFENAKRTPQLKRIIQIGHVTEEDRKTARDLGIHIISFCDAEELGQNNIKEKNPPKPEDIFTICYTSGTTGTPKGVIHTHGNVVADIAGVLLQYKAGRLELYPSDVHLSYLPLAHAYERMIHIVQLQHGSKIGYFRGDARLLLEDIQELKPTIFAAVPRLLNRIYDKVMSQVSDSKVKKWLFEKALRSKEADLKRNVFRGNTIWDKVVFKKIQQLFGGNVRLVTCGAAPLSAKVMTFFKCSMGKCYIMEGYGQTECTAAATLQFEHDMSSGHVGPPLPCNIIKLVDVPEKKYFAKEGKGEVCIKGPNVIRGYLKDPKKTAETIDQDGWLHTGDVGVFQENGTLRIIDRSKHIFKLAQGEYIAPSKIENIYIRSPFVSQVFVHGEGLKTFVVGIVVPDQEVLEKWAKSQHLEGDFKTLCQKEEVRKTIFEDMTNKAREGKLVSFEQVKAIHLHPDPFSVENGLLTITFKSKRPVLQKVFDEQISELYREVDARNIRSQSEVEVNLEIDQSKLSNCN